MTEFTNRWELINCEESKITCGSLNTTSVFICWVYTCCRKDRDEPPSVWDTFLQVSSLTVPDTKIEGVPVTHQHVLEGNIHPSLLSLKSVFGVCSAHASITMGCKKESPGLFIICIPVQAHMCVCTLRGQKMMLPGVGDGNWIPPPFFYRKVILLCFRESLWVAQSWKSLCRLVLPFLDF